MFSYSDLEDENEKNKCSSSSKKNINKKNIINNNNTNDKNEDNSFFDSNFGSDPDEDSDSYLSDLSDLSEWAQFESNPLNWNSSGGNEDENGYENINSLIGKYDVNDDQLGYEDSENNLVEDNEELINEENEDNLIEDDDEYEPSEIEEINDDEGKDNNLLEEEIENNLLEDEIKNSLIENENENNLLVDEIENNLLVDEIENNLLVDEIENNLLVGEIENDLQENETEKYSQENKIKNNFLHNEFDNDLQENETKNNLTTMDDTNKNDIKNNDFDDDDDEEFIDEEIFPDHYYDNGGVPVFKPTMSQFKSFSDFIRKIDHYGMQSGIVKVIPPKEWLDSLPSLDDKIKDIRIKHPIVQHINGSNGKYIQQNIERQRIYSIPQWRKIAEAEEHQPPAKRGEKRKTYSTRTKLRNLKSSINESSASSSKPTSTKNKARKSKLEQEDDFDYRFDSSEFTKERCDELEKIYWKTLTFNSPLYGADLPGSLFDDSTTTWNVAHLDNILNNLDVELPGVNTAYLYFGMWKSTFAWHLEDMDLYSINYIHFGAPKQWYSISQRDASKFYNLMKGIWPQEQKNCSEFLRHKTFFASPSLLASHGIRVNKLVHYQGEFVITFPYGYHAGYNMGYNCAESINFATPSWLEYGLKAKKCECIADSVGIDVRRFVRILNGENLDPTEICTADIDMKSGLASPPGSQLGDEHSFEKKKVRKRASRNEMKGKRREVDANKSQKGKRRDANVKKLQKGNKLEIETDSSKKEKQQEVKPNSSKKDKQLEAQKRKLEKVKQREIKISELQKRKLSEIDPNAPPKQVRRKRRVLGIKSTEYDIQLNALFPSPFWPCSTRPAQKCCLCPNTTPDLDLCPTANSSKEIHTICAVYTPEPYFGQDEKGNEVVYGTENITNNRSSVKCLYCNSTRGFFFKCSYIKCGRLYHASCATTAGVLVEITTDSSGNHCIEYLCKFHRPKRDPGRVIESKPEIWEYGESLTSGTIVQAMYERNDYFAGVVVENFISEGMVRLEVLPYHEEIVEIEYKNLLIPPNTESAPAFSSVGSWLPTKPMKQIVKTHLPPSKRYREEEMSESAKQKYRERKSQKEKEKRERERIEKELERGMTAEEKIARERAKEREKEMKQKERAMKKEMMQKERDRKRELKQMERERKKELKQKKKEMEKEKGKKGKEKKEKLIIKLNIGKGTKIEKEQEVEKVEKDDKEVNVEKTGEPAKKDISFNSSILSQPELFMQDKEYIVNFNENNENKNNEGQHKTAENNTELDSNDFYYYLGGDSSGNNAQYTQDLNSKQVEYVPELSVDPLLSKKSDSNNPRIAKYSRYTRSGYNSDVFAPSPLSHETKFDSTSTE